MDEQKIKAYLIDAVTPKSGLYLAKSQRPTSVGENGKIIGDMRATGLRPLFTPRLEVAGFKLGGEIFGAV